MYAVGFALARLDRAAGIGTLAAALQQRRCVVSFAKGVKAMSWRLVEWSIVMGGLCWLLVYVWTDRPLRGSPRRRRRDALEPHHGRTPAGPRPEASGDPGDGERPARARTASARPSATSATSNHRAGPLDGSAPARPGEGRAGARSTLT